MSDSSEWVPGRAPRRTRTHHRPAADSPPPTTMRVGLDRYFREEGKNSAGPGTEAEEGKCIVDEDRLCPPSRYDCPRPCPYTGWGKRTLEKEA